MAFNTLLKQRCKLLELNETNVDGLVSHVWTVVTGGENVRCFLDLNYIRKGKDPIWTPEAGRATDRTGVLFLAPNAPVKSGHRVEMLKGPLGTFSVEGAVDEAWTPKKLHHLEVGVQEVGSVLAKGSTRG
jgi:hypothetical protein